MLRLPRFRQFSLSSPLSFTLIYSAPFLVVLCLLLVFLLIWEGKKHEEEQIAELIEAGRAFFKQIVIARTWNAQHGGVYVEISDNTQPNPFLDDPKRDIVSISGKRYTKINPAYMTRQMSLLAAEKGDYKFHITSLKPINPHNNPDEWEATILKDFEEGVEEGYTVATIDGKKHFRYMGPLIVESPCLKCHARQGYEVGDIRGGISVNIPTETSDTIHMAKVKRDIISYSSVVIASMLFIVGITWTFSRKVIKGIEKDMEHKRLEALIELAGATAHELRQPLTVLIGFIELLSAKDADDELTDEHLDKMLEQCSRMDDIIRKMYNITHYKTKEYSDGVKILDLHEETEFEDKEERE